MIVSAPTALYSSILPQSAETPGNVTFTISSNDPPRTESFVSQLAPSADLRDLPDKIYTPKERRERLGDLIFSVSFGAQGPAGFGQKAFEVGQVLEFQETEIDLPEPEVTLVDLQQNLNLLDFESMGLTEEQIEWLTNTSNEQFNKLIVDLNVVLSNISSAETAISDNQKKINETKKAQNAAQVLYDLTGEGKDILDSLTEELEGLEEERVDLAAYYTEQIDESKRLYDQILQVREIVR